MEVRSQPIPRRRPGYAAISGGRRWSRRLRSGDRPNLWFKPECLQVSGSFKARGAFNAVLSHPRRNPVAAAWSPPRAAISARPIAYAAPRARHPGPRRRDDRLDRTRPRPHPLVRGRAPRHRRALGPQLGGRQAARGRNRRDAAPSLRPGTGDRRPGDDRPRNPRGHARRRDGGGVDRRRRLDQRHRRGDQAAAARRPAGRRRDRGLPDALPARAGRAYRHDRESSSPTFRSWRRGPPSRSISRWCERYVDDLVLVPGGRADRGGAVAVAGDGTCGRARCRDGGRRGARTATPASATRRRWSSFAAAATTVCRCADTAGDGDQAMPAGSSSGFSDNVRAVTVRVSRCCARLFEASAADEARRQAVRPPTSRPLRRTEVAPASQLSLPLTKTFSMPAENCCGSS